ncbi:MAG: zinc-binding dehydrogenase [Alphaproteobacteria bacterium]
MVPTSSYGACIAALNSGGRYFSGNPRLSIMLRSALTDRFTDKTASFAFAKETKEELLALKEMIEDGRIKSIVDRKLPMHHAADSHRLVETEERCGAIVLLIRDHDEAGTENQVGRLAMRPDTSMDKLHPSRPHSSMAPPQRRN